VELVTDVTRADTQITAEDAQLGEVVTGTGTGTSLTDIKGAGVVMAALILGEVGDVRRFPSNHHATYTGSAPTEASSGEITRHRLSRAGNRRLNHALHVAALSHRPYDDRGRVYYDHKVAEGKGKRGAMRCLKRRLSDEVYRHLAAAARGRR
jgi:transposase